MPKESGACGACVPHSFAWLYLIDKLRLRLFATRRIVFRAAEKIQATAGALKAPAGNPSESSLFFADANAHRNANNLVGLPARRQVH